MSPAPGTPASSLVERVDHLRGSSWPFGAARGFREWLHFVVQAPGITVVSNFSVEDAPWPSASAGEAVGRLTLLVREGERWHGDVRQATGADLRVRPGRIDLRIGRARLRFEGGRFHLAVTEQGLELDLVLSPVSFPSPANNVPLGGAATLHWLVVPHLHATGTVTVAGRRHELDRAPAYHDHNWGTIYGADLSWEWGFVLPRGDERWSVVAVRIGDRARSRVAIQALLVWDGGRQARVFRGTEVRWDLVGFCHEPAALTIPRPLALLRPGTASDVPRTARVQAAGEGDHVDLRFDTRSYARILAPAGPPPGLLAIHEAEGEGRVDGVVRGDPVHLSGSALFEFLDG